MSPKDLRLGLGLLPPPYYLSEIRCHEHWANLALRLRDTALYYWITTCQSGGILGSNLLFDSNKERNLQNELDIAATDHFFFFFTQKAFLNHGGDEKQYRFKELTWKVFILESMVRSKSLVKL